MMCACHAVPLVRGPGHVHPCGETGAPDSMASSASRLRYALDLMVRSGRRAFWRDGSRLEPCRPPGWGRPSFETRSSRARARLERPQDEDGVALGYELSTRVPVALTAPADPA